MAEMWAKRHPVISTAIATLLGSMFFKEPREFLYSIIAGFWDFIAKCFRWTVLDVSIPRWLLIILVFLSAIIILQIGFKLFKKDNPEYYGYTEDSINGITWRWDWGFQGVVNLRPYCPNCDMCLTYILPQIWDEAAGTSFYCDRCEQTMATIKGGGEAYTKGVIVREIDRKVRNKLYKTDNQ